MARILVTNDDGIDSTGLHVLARTMRQHGEVVVVAPEVEHSGAGAGVGPLHLINPMARTTHIDGVEEAWCLNGSPALCTMFARFGVFGPVDLVVSGINPGANVGRAIYHSGTIGAALTARSGSVSGVAVSQAVAGYGIEGQGWDDMILDQKWQTAADVAAVVVGELVASPPSEPVVVNINVPNLPLDEISGWRHATVAATPPRALTAATLVPVTGKEGCFAVHMEYGDPILAPSDTDSGAIERDEVAITYLSRIQPEPRDDLGGIDKALESLLGDTEQGLGGAEGRASGGSAS
jgi:5'/3'-nucleotidase